MKFWNEMRQMPREIWVLFLTTLINRLGTMVLPFLILYLTRELQFSVTQAGFLMAVYGIGAMITAPLSGMLCDRFGAAKILKLSLVLSSVCFFAYPLFTSFGGVFFITLLVAITAEMFRPASATLVSGAVQPEKRKMAYALYRQAISIGMSIGPAAGGFLAEVSFLYIFLADGLTSVLGGLIAILGMRSQPKQAESDVEGGPLRDVSVWKDRQFLFYLLALLPVMLVFFQHISTMPLYMVRDLKLSEASFGLSFTFNTILILIFEVPFNYYTAHWSFRKALPIGAFLIGIGFGAMMFAYNFWTILVTVFIWTVGEMMFLPGTAAYVAEVAPNNRQGQYMGLYTMAFSVAFTIGPWLGTAIMEKYGSLFLWMMMFVLGATSAALLCRIKIPQSKVLVS